MVRNAKALLKKDGCGTRVSHGIALTRMIESPKIKWKEGHGMRKIFFPLCLCIFFLLPGLSSAGCTDIGYFTNFILEGTNTSSFMPDPRPSSALMFKIVTFDRPQKFSSSGAMSVMATKF